MLRVMMRRRRRRRIECGCPCGEHTEIWRYGLRFLAGL
jgi:hypothetical protein